MNEEKDTITDKMEEKAENSTVETTEETAQISELEKLQSEITEMKDKYLRLFAEFDNYKRRTAKERVDTLQTANKELMVALLPILDDFERTNKSLETAESVEAVKEGVALVHHKLWRTLEQKGLKPLETTGTLFDSELHEAVTQIPAPSEELKGTVVDELEKGYLLNDKIIRYAKVVIGS